MSFQHTYREFFRINIYHHYWLNDGQTPFDDPGKPDLKDEQLEKYNLRHFIDIVPSQKTTRFLQDQKLFFKLNTKGFYLVGKVTEEPLNSGVFEPFKSLTSTDTFTFLLYVSDALFENYSTVPAHPETPFFFSNVQPETEGVGFKDIDLEDTTTSIEEYVMTNDTYEDLSENLKDNEKIGLFGIIKIHIEGDDNDKNILNGDGTIKNDVNQFKIQIINRNTIWHYRNAQGGDLIHDTDPTELPLVKNGIVGYTDGDDNEMPSAIPNRLLFVDNGGNIKTISEIYIN